MSGFRFFDCLQEQHQSAKTDKKVDQQKRVLPVLALNEVLIKPKNLDA